MAILTGRGEGGKIAKEICDVLGLKHVRCLDLHMAINDIFTVTATFYPEIEGVKQFSTIIKKYKLALIDENEFKEPETE